LYCCLAIPAATAALSGVDPLHLGPLSPTLPDVVSGCSSRLVPGLVASENVVGVSMYEFVAGQVFGISGLINLSNIVFLVAFSVRDVLQLRILAIVGEGLTLPYYYFQGEKLWPPIVWGAAFMIVNAIRVVAGRKSSFTASHSARLTGVNF